MIATSSPGNIAQQRPDERVMGAAEHQRIDAGRQHRLDDALQKAACLRRVQRPGLDQLHETGTGVFVDLNIGRVSGHETRIAMAVDVVGVARTPTLPLWVVVAAGLTAGSMPTKITSGNACRR